MNIGVVGGRDFNDYESMEQVLFSVVEPTDDKIISGGAAGADTLAERFAKENNIPTKIYKADWKNLGKSAGILRNRDIIAQSDYIVAFWDGKSKGTKDTIDKAFEKGVAVLVIEYTPLDFKVKGYSSTMPGDMITELD